jgi:hypothetical protein
MVVYKGNMHALSMINVQSEIEVWDSYLVNTNCSHYEKNDWTKLVLTKSISTKTERSLIFMFYLFRSSMTDVLFAVECAVHRSRARVRWSRCERHTVSIGRDALNWWPQLANTAVAYVLRWFRFCIRAIGVTNRITTGKNLHQSEIKLNVLIFALLC